MEHLVPIAISSQLDVTGEERIHAAKYTETVRPWVLVLLGDLQDGVVGESGTYQYTVAGTYPPFTVATIDGALPSGAVINADGLVTYTYDTADVYNWELEVTDAMGNTTQLLDTAEVISNNMFIAVSSNGEIASSLDGVTWALVTDTGDDLRRIEYVNDRWIATSGDASSTHMSTDGVTWTPGVLSAPSTASFNNLPVTWTNAAGYIVGKDTSTFYTSPDGIAWTSATIDAGTTSLGGAASNGTDILFGDNSRTAWKSEDDGATWNSFTTVFAAGSDIYDLVWSTDHSLYAAVAVNNGVTSIITSPDGETWTSRRGGSSQFRGIHYAYTAWVAVGDGPLIVYSTGGPPTVWNTGTHTFTDSINDVTAGAVGENVVWVAVSSANEIEFSIDDGATWSPAVSPFTTGAVIRSVAWGTASG